MSRILTIWLPRWSVQRRLLERPELRRVPVFVCRREHRGAMKVASWAWAAPPRRFGASAGVVAKNVCIREGMSLAEAMAVLAAAYGSRACHVAEIDHDDPGADQAALERIARSCRRFAPIVAIGDPVAGGVSSHACLHVDVSGTVGFFGGEGPLVRTAVWTLAARGIHARAAIADTPAAAWAAAQHTDSLSADPVCGMQPVPSRFAGMRRRRWAIVPVGGQLQSLGMLPASALSLGAHALAQLAEVGIDTIGGVARLSRKSLASRFDPQLSRRLALFMGECVEPLSVPRSAELPSAVHAFDFPVALCDMTAAEMAVILQRLVGACIEPLVAAGKGVTSLQVRLDRAQLVGYSEPSAPMIVDVGMFQPSGCVKHIVDLMQLRLQRLRLPREIVAIAVDVISVGIAACRQRTLFGEPTQASALQVGMLLDRLSGRLGSRAVFEPMAAADAQPEHAWTAVPPLRSARKRASSTPSPGGRASRSRRWRANDATGSCSILKSRPIWLLSRPVRLEAVVVRSAEQPVVDGVGVVNGPPSGFRLVGRTHAIVKAHGPERIETAWWRGPTVRRDYYVVETDEGGRYWIFRRLGGGARASAFSRSEEWFLHGTFS